MKADAVLEGGGVRGIAYCGAVEVLERAGFEWNQIAGTSAGAIVGSMLACGLKSRDIFDVMASTDFARFLDFEWNPLVRWRRCGEFRGDYFEAWLRDVTGGKRMGETALPLTVFTSDLRNSEALAISSSSHPDLIVARAARLSMSIPHFFLRVDWMDGDTFRQCIDGGVTRNYPIDVFDVGAPQWPTIGFLLDEGPQPPCVVRGHASQARAEVGFMREAPARGLDEHNTYRSVRIPDGGISWLNFRLSREQQDLLVQNGRMAAEAFLYRWNNGGGFDGYVSKYRAA